MNGLRPNRAGEPRRGGRVKGVPNKATASIKGAFAEAFEKLGGADALVAWGRNNETEFYRLASKLIPTEVNASVNATVALRTAAELSDDELAQVARG